MRIVVVSAHFPPNFVSGGTLQPQGLARGLRSRGHDVSVYAGWLGDDHAPGRSWDEPDEDGLPVRWIASTPWTAWSQRANFDNPTVADDFARYLRDMKPEVVHFHSLQSLGAGLLRVAADHGAKVVVTMHDFWWCCARQFLVDRGNHPCAEVVAAGVCECEVDRGWLEERNAWLHGELRHADLVLTPSAAARAVLVANGIANDHIHVDENGVLAATTALPPPRSRRQPPDRPVRLLYAGGADELKGVRVLFDACQQLASVPGWHLRAHGARPWLTEHGRSIHGLPIDVRAPFAVEETAAVLDAADVLVVPSLARESYSILTREALAQGLAVICSDCLGPEEVVEHGRNGLIVPSGDAGALAGAIRRVVEDRGLLDTLLGDSGAVTLRSLDDQVEGLEEHYRALLGSPARVTAAHGGIRRVLFVAGITGAPLRYRAWLPSEALGLLGVDSEVVWFTDPDLPTAVDRADAVVVYRVPATPWVLDAITRARQRGVTVLFDADDLIFDPDVARTLPALARMTPEESEEYLDGVRRYRTTMEACDVYLASTPMLARHARDTVGLPVERFDNGVGMVMGRHADRARRRSRAPGPVRIGYFSGTDTHDDDWWLIEPVLEQILSRNPDVELWTGGHVPTTPVLDRFGGRIRRLPFQPWTELPAVLRDVDVNLAPLVLGSDFNEAKSAIKWLEGALCGTPTVASATKPFRDAIDHGRTGFLAGSHDEWVDAIELLVEDEALRRRIGDHARRSALLRWSPHLQARRYLDILERARSLAPSPRVSTWSSVVTNEPPRRVTLEPYFETDWPPSQANRARRLERQLRAAIDMHGVGGTIRRLPRAAVRAMRDSRR